jgi:hypothetical protein
MAAHRLTTRFRVSTLGMENLWPFNSTTILAEAVTIIHINLSKMGPLEGLGSTKLCTR